MSSAKSGDAAVEISQIARVQEGLVFRKIPSRSWPGPGLTLTVEANRRTPGGRSKAGTAQRRHDVKVVAGEERFHEIAGQALRRRHGNEVQERIQTEHDEDESKQTPCDDSQDFHLVYGWLGRSLVFKLQLISVEVKQKDLRWFGRAQFQ